MILQKKSCTTAFFMEKVNKSNRKHPVLMLLAIVLMALISIHGCGLDNSADADLLLEEQMIKDGTHPILGSWAIYALVDANGLY